MVYKEEISPTIVLARGEDKGYKYVITSNGLYPECYIQIPTGHALARRGEGYVNSKIKLHGSISYYGVNANGQIPYLDIGHRVYGWSYSQMGDYVGYYKKCGYTPIEEMKEWTTQEIVSDIKQAIKQMEGIKYGQLF